MIAAFFTLVEGVAKAIAIAAIKLVILPSACLYVGYLVGRRIVSSVWRCSRV